MCDFVVDDARAQQPRPQRDTSWFDPSSIILLDHHVDTMLLHDLLFELSPDASVDQESNPLADPKRLMKRSSTCPNETVVALHAYSLPLQAHTPVDPRTPVDSFDADIAHVAPNCPVPRTEHKTLLPANLVDHAASSTSDCDAPDKPCCSPARNTAV